MYIINRNKGWYCLVSPPLFRIQLSSNLTYPDNSCWSANYRGFWKAKWIVSSSSYLALSELKCSTSKRRPLTWVPSPGTGTRVRGARRLGSITYRGTEAQVWTLHLHDLENECLLKWGTLQGSPAQLEYWPGQDPKQTAEGREGGSFTGWLVRVIKEDSSLLSRDETGKLSRVGHELKIQTNVASLTKRQIICALRISCGKMTDICKRWQS